MKRFVIPAVVLGVVALAIGPRLLWSHIRGARDGAIKTIEESLPDDQVVAQAADELKQFNVAVRDYHLKVTGIGDQLAAAKAQLERIEKQLDAEKRILGNIKRKLDSSEDQFKIGSRNYTRADINSDGKARLAKCTALDEQLRSQQKLVAELEKAYMDGRKWLAEAEQARTQRAAELQTLTERLAISDEYRKLAQFTLTPLMSADSDTAKHLTMLSERVKKRERGNEYDAATNRDGTVDWSTSTADTRDAIGKYLKTSDTVPISEK
jgi:chromosome segregation ATPase